MPTVVTGILAPADATATRRQNIVEAIDAIDPRDTPLLSAKGWSAEAGGAAAGANSLSRECIDTTYQWQNDSLIPVSTTLLVARVSGDGTIDVAAGTAQYFVVNEVLVLSSGANTTHLQVTAVDTTNDRLSVSVLRGDAAHAIGTRVTSLGRPRAVGEQSDTTGRVAVATLDTNYTEIFMETVSISGTEQAVEKIGIGNRLDRESAKTLAQEIIRLETNLLYGSLSSVSPLRMGGAFDFISVQANGQVTNAGGASLATSESSLKDLLDTLYGVGGKPDTILVDTFQRRAISSFLAPFVRTSRDEGVAGVVVGQYEYSHGVLNVVLDRYVRPAHLWAFTMEYIGIGPLMGNGVDRSFHWIELAKVGDMDRRAVVGEYSKCSTGGRPLVKNLSEFGEPWDVNLHWSGSGNAEPTYLTVGGVETKREALHFGDDAIVRSHAKDKHERLAEMASPVSGRVSKAA